MTYFRTGDAEPEHGIDVLLPRTAPGPDRRYLARFQHGWRWVRGRTELRHRQQTPLTWKFATSPDPGGTPTELRTLTDTEHAEWLDS